MLTPKEQAELNKLQAKAKEWHQNLTETEIQAMEDRATNELNSSVMRYEGLIQAWNQLCQWSMTLGKDNMRLIQEVRWYREQIKNNENTNSPKTSGLETEA